jgi:hypothetical protein
MRADVVGVERRLSVGSDLAKRAGFQSAFAAPDAQPSATAEQATAIRLWPNGPNPKVSKACTGGKIAAAHGGDIGTLCSAGISRQAK